MKKFALIFVMLVFFLTGCANNEQTPNDLMVSNGDNEIQYFKNVTDTIDSASYFYEQKEKGELIKVPQGEIIRVEFLNKKPDKNEIILTKYPVNNGSAGAELYGEQKLKSNYIDLVHEYDDMDTGLEGIVYSISCDFGGEQISYQFAVGIDNKVNSIDEDNPNLVDNLKIYAGDREIMYSQMQYSENPEALASYFYEQDEKGELLEVADGTNLKLEFLKEQPYNEEVLVTVCLIRADGEGGRIISRQSFRR